MPLIVRGFGKESKPGGVVLKAGGSLLPRTYAAVNDHNNLMCEGAKGYLYALHPQEIAYVDSSVEPEGPVPVPDPYRFQCGQI